jgi:hypothetical protein
MRGGEQGPISPELVLVMSPDEARRAREALPAVLIYDPSRARHERVAAERMQEVLPVEVAAAETDPAADVVPVAVEEADRVEELEQAAAEDDGGPVNEEVAEAERRRELERAVAALAGRVAASEARRVATSEARRVAAAEAERVAACVLAQAAAVATEAERAAGERLEAERVASSAAAADAGEEEREQAAVEQLHAERAPEQGEAKPESEPAAEWHEPKPEREPEAEPARRFQVVESGIKPSDRTVPAVASDQEDWSYPATRPKARTIVLAAALGVVAFGAGLLVQKKFVGDSASSVANVVAAAPAVSARTVRAGGQQRTTLSRPLRAKGSPTRSSESAQPPLGFVPARVWGWKTQPGARGYHVRFFLNNRQVFSARTTKTQLTLPRSFRYQAGRYRWLVRAIPKLAEPIVDTTFLLTRRSASAANSVTQPHA